MPLGLGTSMDMDARQAWAIHGVMILEKWAGKLETDNAEFYASFYDMYDGAAEKLERESDMGKFWEQANSFSAQGKMFTEFIPGSHTDTGVSLSTQAGTAFGILFGSMEFGLLAMDTQDRQWEKAKESLLNEYAQVAEKMKQAGFDMYSVNYALKKRLNEKRQQKWINAGGTESIISHEHFAIALGVIALFD
tara:strand:- start:373 stop:948 length:576 start_codon:yes stop_codon:yes gene_type:complete